MWLLRRSSLLYFLSAFLLAYMNPVCGAFTNSNFNNNLREFSVRDNSKNTTVLKQGTELYTNFVPISNPVTFKEADNHVSSSSYSRDHLPHTDYGVYNYEGSPQYGHGYENQIQDTGNYGYHAFDHQNADNFHSGYNGGHQLEYQDGQHHVGSFHKNYDHTQAVKKILWPLAGIAILGAAAAFITNPVLLQLGVVSGKRKRRDTEEVTGPDLNLNLKKWPQNLVITNKINTEQKKDNLGLSLSNFPIIERISMENRKHAPENVAPTELSRTDNSLEIHNRRSKLTREDNFIPIPLKIKPS